MIKDKDGYYCPVNLHPAWNFGEKSFKLIESIGSGQHSGELVSVEWLYASMYIQLSLIFSSFIKQKEPARQDCSWVLQYKTMVEKIKEVMFETPVVVVKHPEETVSNSKIRGEFWSLTIAYFC